MQIIELNYISTLDRLLPSKITKTLHQSYWNTGWCSWIGQTGDNEFDITYTAFDDPTDTTSITKRYPNSFRVAEFEEGFDFSTMDLELEVYKSHGTRSRGQKRTRSHAHNQRLVYTTKTNHIPLAALAPDKSMTSVYSFRFIDNKGKYSDFFHNKMQVKRTPLVITDPSLSANDVIGNYRNAYLI